MTRIRTIAVNTITATAICLAAITAGPAQAATRDDDLLKALAGVAAVAVFAGLISQQQRNRDAATRTQPLPLQPELPAWGNQGTGWQNDRWRDDGLQGDRAGNRTGPRLPGVCAFDIGSAARPATLYAESCLRREGLAYGLPRHCARQINRRDFQGRAYEADCLRDAGYRAGHWR
jgi:hypothetical protein